MKRKIPLMILTILILQVLLPTLTIVWESGFTIKSIAATTYEATANGITWEYEVEGNQAINVRPKNKNSLPANVIIPTKLSKYSVTSIQGNAFYDCSSLQSIRIPNTVTSIEGNEFNGCSSLTSITVEEGNKNYSSENGILFDKGKTSIIKYPAGKVETTYVIPEGVTSIGNVAFAYCSKLTSITIPNSVTSIGLGAFGMCSSLESITIPEGVTSIGTLAFMSCSSLRSINFSEESQLISIEAFTFWGCSSLESIRIPKDLTVVDVNNFIGCSSLKSITVDKDNQNYSSDENGILFNKDKTSIIKYPAGKTEKIYVIPEGVTTIGGTAFEDCSSLEKIIIPNSVTSIQGNAFDWYSNLTIYCNTNSTAADYAEANKIGIKYEIDDQGPTIISIEENTNETTGETVVTVDAADELSGLAEEAYSFDGGTTWQKDPTKKYAEDEENVQIQVRDNLGNIGTANAANTLEATVDEITWEYEVEGNQAINVQPKDRSNLPQEVEIPSELNGCIVTSIGKDAFYGCSSLTSITIPDSVTSIKWRAFYNCENLTNIEIPNSVTYIEISTFYGCSSLESITIPNSVTTIGKGAFYNCENLTNIEIPNNVTSIGSGTFDGCSSLESITIPNTVTSIGYCAFNRCSSLASIAVEEGNQNYSSEEGILFNEDKTSIIKYPAGKTEPISYTIPSSVTSIEDYAFEECSSLESITIPNSVTSIGGYAFLSCSSLTSITIPNSVTSIENKTFYGCSSLASIEIPNSVTSIKWSAFSDCSSLTSIQIPNSVTSIENGAFSNCSSLESITIPKSITSIGDDAFEECNNLTIYCNNNSTAATYAWYKNIECGIDNKGPIITSIEKNTNESTGETVVTVNAVEELSGLAKEAYSFDGGQNWQAKPTKTYTENTENIQIQVRDNLGNIGKNIEATDGKGITWKYEWKDNQAINVQPKDRSNLPQEVEIPSELNGCIVTSIGDHALLGCSSVTSIIIPNSVTSIGIWAFYGCSKLENIEISNGVTRIGDYVFAVCNSLESITIPNSVTTIGKGAFYNCENLTNIEIPNSVTRIGDSAFEGCNSLESITIPNSVTGIGANAFASCSSLIIYCNSDSTAKTYAVNNNINYEIIEVEEISVTTAPTKTTYFLGDSLNTEGLELTLTYNNGTTQEITQGFTCTPTELNNAGTQEITVTYGGKTATFNVTVIKKGDVNGDNVINFNDILAINKHRLKKSSLEGIYLKAADVTGDKKVDFMDILKVNKYRLGKINSL